MRCVCSVTVLRFLVAGRRQEVTAKSQASCVESSPCDIHTSAGRSKLALCESPWRGWRKAASLSVGGGPLLGLRRRRRGHRAVLVVAVPCEAAHSRVVAETVKDLVTQGALRVPLEKRDTRSGSPVWMGTRVVPSTRLQRPGCDLPCGLSHRGVQRVGIAQAGQDLSAVDGSQAAS